MASEGTPSFGTSAFATQAMALRTMRRKSSIARICFLRGVLEGTLEGIGEGRKGGATRLAVGLVKGLSFASLMLMKVSYERVRMNSDPRGSVWEPIIHSDLASQRNCHVVVTEPGCVRGNHYHKLGTEIATQSGPALVRYRDETGVHSVEIAEGEAVQFVFPPNCSHAYKNIGDCPNLLVAFNTEAFDPSSPDGYPEVLIES